MIQQFFPVINDGMQSPRLLLLTIVTTAHQNESGIDLNSELSLPASAKYTADEKSTTPAKGRRI
jgi:hypothetical protein